MPSVGIMVSIVLFLIADGRPKQSACRRSYVYADGQLVGPLRVGAVAYRSGTYDYLPPKQASLLSFLRGQPERLAIAVETELLQSALILGGDQSEELRQNSRSVRS